MANIAHTLRVLLGLKMLLRICFHVCVCDYTFAFFSSRDYIFLHQKQKFSSENFLFFSICAREKKLRPREILKTSPKFSWTSIFALENYSKSHTLNHLVHVKNTQKCPSQKGESAKFINLCPWNGFSLLAKNWNLS